MLLLIFVVERVLGEGLCWMFMALCGSLTLLMFEREIKGFASEYYGWECVERFFC